MSTLLGAARQLLRRDGASPGAVVLAYHDVCEAGATGLTVSTNQLASHTDVLRGLGMTIVPLPELVDRLANNAPTDGLAVLSFDDALFGVGDQAMPLLSDREAPATVFVVSNSVGKEPHWWPGSRRVMSHRELEQFADAGHHIGSHTHSHRSLIDCDEVVVEEELTRSREWLATQFGQTIDALAYPSGHHDSRARRAAETAGYRAAFTFLNGRITGAEDRFMIPRLTMGAHMSSRRLAYHLLRTSASWPDHQLPTVGPSQ